MNLMRTLSLFKSIACVAMLSGLFLCSDVSAFGVNWLFFHHIPLPGTPVHEAITRAALLGFPPFRLSSGQVIEFSFPAITQIADENAATDSKATGNPERHFDAESFDDGQSFLIKARKAIISDLKTAVDNGDNARRLLGGSLHTLQDFYAHSTWVENGNHGTAPLGQDGATLSHAAFGADVCDRFGVLVGQPLTSSYWDNVNIVYGSTDYQFIVGYSIHKCGHGKPNTCNDPGLCPSDFLSMLPPILKTDAGGIHKDTNVRQHFHEAATLAEQSTREYIQHIFSDLGSEDLSACKLMGVDCYLLFLKKDGSGSGV
ncbi:MAG: hypothetical protein J0L71_09060, partial [Candidatus Accumulibacter sp.]|nr:hypothetical protein [Accumulibacter sp.]